MKKINQQYTIIVLIMICFSISLYLLDQKKTIPFKIIKNYIINTESNTKGEFENKINKIISQENCNDPSVKQELVIGFISKKSDEYLEVKTKTDKNPVIVFFDKDTFYLQIVIDKQGTVSSEKEINKKDIVENSNAAIIVNTGEKLIAKAIKIIINKD